jgi:hypothetical protein
MGRSEGSQTYLASRVDIATVDRVTAADMHLVALRVRAVEPKGSIAAELMRFARPSTRANASALRRARSGSATTVAVPVR